MNQFLIELTQVSFGDIGGCTVDSVLRCVMIVPLSIQGASKPPNTTGKRAVEISVKPTGQSDADDCHHSDFSKAHRQDGKESFWVQGFG